MKRDNTAIGERIKALGLTYQHVADQVKVTPASFTRIVQGAKGYGSEKTINIIHEYLDLCKTRFKKGKDFGKE